MEKTIKIGNKSVRLDNNIGWALTYRDQFGQDIVPALMPLIAGALDIVAGVVAQSGTDGKIDLEKIAQLADGDALINAVIHLGGFELTDFVRITWALAKNADEDIPEPEAWVREFDSFPLDIIAPAVAGLIVKGVVSSKNLKRLETLKKQLQPRTEPLTQIQSSSQEQKED